MPVLSTQSLTLLKHLHNKNDQLNYQEKFSEGLIN